METNSCNFVNYDTISRMTTAHEGDSMHHFFRYSRYFRSYQVSLALGAITIAGLSGQAAQAQFTYTSNNASYAVSFSDVTFADAQVQYDSSYNVTGNAGTESKSFSIFGDLNSFFATGVSPVSGGVFTVVNNGTTPIGGFGNGTGTASLTKDGNAGAFDYGYNAYNGDQIISVGTFAGSTQMLFDSANPDSSELGSVNEVDISLPGNWSTFDSNTHQIADGSFAISSNYTITNNFVYESAFEQTFFSATLNPGATGTPNVSFILNGVPEPGNVAMLAGLGLTSVGFLARQRRRRA